MGWLVFFQQLVIYCKQQVSGLVEKQLGMGEIKIEVEVLKKGKAK